MKQLVADGEKKRGRAERHRKRHWPGAPTLSSDNRQLRLHFEFAQPHGKKRT